MRALLAWVILTATACAQATAIITGPKEVAPGDLVILDASGSDADSLQWMLANSDKSFLQFEGNRKCVFASGVAGTYEFILSTAKCVDGTAAIAVTRHTLTVGSPEPSPSPKPTPKPQPINPSPTPQPEPFLSVTATGARDAARQVKYKPGEPSRLAEVYERTASQAGALSWDMARMQQELNTSFLKTDADASTRWEPYRQWFRRASAAWTTPEIAAEQFFEIAKGLHAVEVKSAEVPVTSGESIKERVQGISQALDAIEQEVGN